MNIYIYNIKEYPFAELIKNKLNVQDLSKLHLTSKERGIEHEGYYYTDQCTSFHKSYYSLYEKEEFFEIYESFLENEIKPIFKEEIVYQRRPTFRVHMPNTQSIFSPHKDSDYNHSTNEINFWLPFTDAFDTNTLWVENDEDYKPVELKIGEYLMFDGANTMHGVKINQTGKTRVSIDFRVMPMSKYQESEKTSSATKTKFSIGHYYEKI